MESAASILGQVGNIEDILKAVKDEVSSVIEDLHTRCREQGRELAEKMREYDNLLRSKSALAGAKMRVEQELGKVKGELADIRGATDETLDDTEIIKQIAFHTKRAADLSARLASKSSVSSGVKAATCGICKDHSAIPNYVLDGCGHGFCEKCSEDTLGYEIASSDYKVCPVCREEGVFVVTRNVYREETII